MVQLESSNRIFCLIAVTAGPPLSNVLRTYKEGLSLQSRILPGIASSQQRSRHLQQDHMRWVCSVSMTRQSKRLQVDEHHGRANYVEGTD